MVIVKNYHLREGEKGSYVTLELQGDMELVQSQNTGRFYATARRCSIYSTFDEYTASRMIGTEMEGRIQRVPCEPYEYTIPESGEVVVLTHSWDYTPEEAPAPHHQKLKMPIGIVEYPRQNHPR